MFYERQADDVEGREKPAAARALLVRDRLALRLDLQSGNTISTFITGLNCFYFISEWEHWKKFKKQFCNH